MTSSQGNKYVMVMYDMDSNSIRAEPLKNRSQEQLVEKQIALYTYLAGRGFTLKVQVLDNECPKRLISHFLVKGIHFTLVLSHLHRANAAERAIQTFKDYLIGGLASCDPSFPLHLWDRLIPQATITLNLLRPARFNPRLSAHDVLNGTFDYNKTPLAPPGTKVLVYEPPSLRKTWGAHCVEGWYLGPAPNHYRCHRCFITKTRSERISNTVKFLPHSWRIPALSSRDAAIEAAENLTVALENPHPASILAPLKIQQTEALDKLA